jgi:hydroxymethylpyrimidine pyrophosphatase-like HAD family hydrolase
MFAIDIMLLQICILMIEYAGLGVAMGNASDIVKDRADYITDTNDNDGVAKVIDKFVLNQGPTK